MSYEDSLSHVLKYSNTKSERFLPVLSDPTDLTAPLVFADWLEEKDRPEPEMADRLRREVQRQREGHPIRPMGLGDEYSGPDTVLNAVRTGHPNPTVRALANKFDELPHPHFFDLLFHSNSEAAPWDHDVAVYLHPEDGSSTHSVHSQLKTLNSRPFRESGLEGKVVRGQLYLLDHDAPDPRAYGAPAIVFHSPVNDPSEVKALVDHGRKMVAERSGVGTPVA